MLGQMPDLTPEGDDTACGQPRFAWVEGSADTGLVPAEARGGTAGPDGLDYEALLEGLAASGRRPIRTPIRRRCSPTSWPRPPMGG